MVKFIKITPEVFYCDSSVSDVITDESISWLISKAHESSLNKARICLHNSPDDLLHQMIIVQKNGNYIKPHINRTSEKFYYFIKGEMQAVIFNEGGEIIKTDALSVSQNFIYKIQKNNFHTFIPLSDEVVYLETVKGPFSRTEFAKWAPDEDENDMCCQYINLLLDRSCNNED